MLNTLAPFQETFRHDVREAYLRDLRNKERANMHEYIKAREYYDGIQYTQLTQRAREYLNVNNDADFTVNYCQMVVNAHANRLKVTGFALDGGQGVDTADINNTLWSWWRKNRMDRQQNIVHHASIRDGDSFVLVEWSNDAGIPRFYFEPAYAGDGVMVYYSEERRNEIKFASKSWRIEHGGDAGKARRLNLYFSNRIEKYISHDDLNDGRYMPYQPESGDSVELYNGYIGTCAVHWWTSDGTETGDPLGVPIVHFAHDDTGQGFGRSKLSSVMPVQDALNKSMVDLLATMDSEGFGLLVGYGTTAWNNAKVAPGAIASVTATPTEAKLERLNGTNPAGLLDVYDSLVLEIARISGTPLSYFQNSGQMPAEGTLKQQESALVSQVEKSQTDYGDAWEQVMQIAIRLNNAFGDNKMATDFIIDTQWEDANSRNEKEIAETLAIKVEQLEVPVRQAWQELNYSPEQIQQFAREAIRKQALAIRSQSLATSARVARAPSTESETGTETAQDLTQTELQEDSE